MQIEGSTFAILLAGCSLLAYALLRVGEVVVRDYARKGKARLILWDRDGGEVKIVYADRHGNTATVGKDRQARTYILEADARMGGAFPTWLVHPEHGWNFIAPKEAEVIKDRHSQLLSISNPAAYHRAISRNDARDAMEANEDDKDKWGWVAPVAVVACIAIVALLGMVGYIVTKIAGAGGAGA